MRLVFLGSGSAFTVGADNFHSNVLLINDSDRKLLIDCGSDLRLSLHQLGFSYLDITDVYVSHLHSDHAGGLEYLGLTTKFDPRCEKPNLYVSQDIAQDIWTKTLSGGMESVEGDTLTIHDFFNLNALKINGYFVWENITFELIATDHINTGHNLLPSYGLFFNLKGQKIFLTGDTKLCLDKLQTYYEQADLIFQDCETSKFPTPVHAHYNQLAQLPANIKQKMWLYGYQPGELPDEQEAGFLGFVKRGQTFEF